MIDYLMTTEYYVGKHGEKHHTNRWIGKGAEALGLDGDVSKEQMCEIGNGFDPVTGKALSRSAGKEAVWHPKLDQDGNQMYGKNGQELGTWRGGHRFGFDCTFSAEKTVSLVFANADVEEKQRLIDAHHRAVESVFSVMEQSIETRRGQGGTQVIGMKGLVASEHLHFGSREKEPQIHSHVMTYAVGQGEDGQWGGWDAKELYDRQRMFGALYRAQHAHEMQELGYGIEKRPELDDEGRKTGEVYYRVAGISDEIRDEFSTRRQQILEYVAEHGGTKDEAALRTRKEKEEPPLDELYKIWEQTLAQVPDMPKPEQIKGLASQTEAVSDEEILQRLHGEEAVWTKTHLITQLARENVGRMTVSEILHEADSFLLRNDLVHIHPEHNPDGIDPDAKPARRYTEDRYAARWWVDGMERSLMEGTAARQEDATVAAKPETVNQAIKDFEESRGFAMSDEQQAAVRHLTGRSGVSILRGWAGTGKTTVSDAVVKTFQAEGRNVIGCSTSWDAAKKIHEETGLNEFYSTDKLLYDLDHGKTTLEPSSVIVMDEAGMAGTAQIARLASHVNEAKCKLILEGDPAQLQAIEAGGGFRMLAEKFGSAELREIRRQRDVEDRKTVEMIYEGDKTRNTAARQEQQELGAKVFERLESRGQIDHWDTRDEAVQALATDYLASPMDARQKIVITGTRADTAELNKAIREGLQERGVVSKDEREFQTLDGGHKQAVKLAEGDRIRFGKRDNDLQIVNGTRGQISKLDDKGLHVRIDDSDRTIVVDPKSYQHLSLDYASTVHRSQGQTREQCFHLASLGMTDRHLSLVAMSRARGSYRMYGAENDLEAIGERLGLDRQKMNALEEGIKQQKPEQELEEQRRRRKDKLGLTL